MQGEARLSLDAGHPVFAGHFPGRPMVPGVMLLDAALHAVVQASGVPAAGCRIASAKFLSPVLPGESLLITYSAGNGGAMRFDISCEGRAIATGSFALGAPA